MDKNLKGIKMKTIHYRHICLYLLLLTRGCLSNVITVGSGFLSTDNDIITGDTRGNFVDVKARLTVSDCKDNLINTICPEVMEFGNLLVGANTEERSEEEDDESAVTTKIPPTSSTTEKSKVDRKNACKNGARYAPHPSDCSRFIQCFAGKYYEGVEMNCPTGLYWNQKILTCDYANNVECATDRSEEEEDDDLPSATEIPPTSSTTEKSKVDISRDCDMRSVPDDRFAFEVQDVGGAWVRQKCPPLTAFSMSYCACTFYLTPDHVRRGCQVELFLTFDINTDDQSGYSVYVRNEGVRVSNGVGLFDGLSRLKIDRFSGAWFDRTVVIHVIYQGEGTPSRQGLICNGDYGRKPSIYVGTTDDAGTEFFVDTYDSPPANISVPFTNHYWQTVTFLLHDGILEGHVDKKSDFQYVKGSVESRQSPLTIGGCEGAEGFVGQIEEVSVSFCHEW